MTTTATTIVALERLGIDEAFVQRSEEGQDRALQRAFPREFVVSAAFSLPIAIDGSAALPALPASKGNLTPAAA